MSETKRVWGKELDTERTLRRTLEASAHPWMTATEGDGKAELEAPRRGSRVGSVGWPCWGLQDLSSTAGAGDTGKASRPAWAVGLGLTDEAS